MSLRLTASNLRAFNDDAMSTVSTRSQYGANDQFAKNIKRSMGNVKNVEDVRKAMTKSTKNQEAEFWAYVEKRAKRAIAKEIPLQPVERICLSELQTQSVDYDFILARLNEEFEINPVSSLTDYHTLPVMVKLSPAQIQEFWDHVATRTDECLNAGGSVLKAVGAVGYKYMVECRKQLLSTRAIGDNNIAQNHAIRSGMDVHAYYDDLASVSECGSGDEDEAMSVHTGVSALTSASLIRRFYKPTMGVEDFYRDVARNVSKPIPMDILAGLPACFHPDAEYPLTPYGMEFDDDWVRQALKYIGNDNISDDDKARAYVVIVNYWNRFKVYVKSEKKVYEVKYNKLGFVDDLTPYDISAELLDDGKAFKLPGGKRDSDNLVEFWKSHEGRCRVMNTTTIPSCGARRSPLYSGDGITPKTLNLFLGFKCEREFDMDTYLPGQLDITPIKTHLSKMCGEKPEVVRYMRKWLHEVLVSKRRTGICPVFYGDQGTGKGVLFDELIGQQIMGLDGGYTQENDINGFTQKFNIDTMNKLLINADEVSGFARKQAGRLKSLLTASYVKGEAKGVDRKTFKNFSNFVMTSNEQNFVVVEETDRRYLIQKVNKWTTTETSRKAYFDPLLACIKNKQSAPEFLKWLAEDTYEDVSLQEIPETVEKKNMVLFNADPWYPWLQGVYMAGSSLWDDGDAVSQKQLVDMYNEKNPKRQASNQEFTKMFTKLGFPEAKGRGKHWHMLKYEDFKTNMEANNKWDSYM